MVSTVLLIAASVMDNYPFRNGKLSIDLNGIVYCEMPRPNTQRRLEERRNSAFEVARLAASGEENEQKILSEDGIHRFSLLFQGKHTKRVCKFSDLDLISMMSIMGFAA